MAITVPSTSAFKDFRQQANRALSDAIKQLIEAKHIYQRLHIDIHEMFAVFRERLPPAQAVAFNGLAAGLMSQRIQLVHAPLERHDSGDTSLLIALDTVKTYCRQCESREVAALSWARDLVEDIERAATT